MTLIREEDRRQAERLRKKLLAIYIVIACVYLVSVLLLILLSPDAYKPFMVGTIVLTIAFGWYSIFFFSVQYDLVRKREKVLDKVLAALPEKEYGIFLKELDAMTYEGVEMRTLRFRVIDDERDIHILLGEIALDEGGKYELEIHSSVLVEIGDCNEEKVP